MKACFCLLLTLAAGWNYNSQGSDWGDNCQSGVDQSPINIDTGSTSKLGSDYQMTIYYYGKTCSRTVVNDGNVVYMEGDFGWISVIDLDGDPRKFLVQKVEFHMESEHKVDDEPAWMEMEIYHKVDDSDYTVDFPSLAVVSVMIRPGDPSYFMDSINVQHLPGPGGQLLLANTSNINLLAIVNPDDNYYFYIGSLTTPDCTGNVLRYVFETWQWVSMDQMSYFGQYWGEKSNVRTVQDVGDRNVYYSAAAPLVITLWLAG